MNLKLVWISFIFTVFITGSMGTADAKPPRQVKGPQFLKVRGTATASFSTFRLRVEGVQRAGNKVVAKGGGYKVVTLDRKGKVLEERTVNFENRTVIPMCTTNTSEKCMGKTIGVFTVFLKRANVYRIYLKRGDEDLFEEVLLEDETGT